jgi:hypothetical protein
MRWQCEEGRKRKRWRTENGRYILVLRKQPTCNTCCLKLNDILLQYQLDDSIEFHNSAEPSTTSCPLLPGQLVNVLNVPFHLSSGRPRNDSVSSTSSELRTMNPEDKFLNPRPVPARPPKPDRLNTSPILPQQPNPSDSSTWSGSPWSAGSLSPSRGGPPCNSATALRKFRLPRKASVGGRSRSISPPSKQTGFRAALRQLTLPRPASPDTSFIRGRTGQYNGELEASDTIPSRSSSGRVSKPSSKSSSKSASREQSPAASAECQALPLPVSHLALRRGLEQPPDLHEAITVSSFQSNRRQRSRSRDPSSLRNSFTMSDDCISGASSRDPSVRQHQALETLKEAVSQQNTPTWPVTARRVDGKDQLDDLPLSALEKRLPTLPNSPSSAYPPSATSDSPVKRLSDELNNLQSHFSEMTVASTSYSSLSEEGRSHFSEWTTTTIDLSPSSDYFIEPIRFRGHESSPRRRPSSPYMVHSIASGVKVAAAREVTFMSEAEMLPSTVSCSTISSCDSTSPPSPSYQVFDLPLNGVDTFTSPEKRYGMTADGHLPGLALSEGLQASDIALKPKKPGLFQEQVEPGTPRVSIRRPASVVQMPHHQGFPHSASMQQLMDELSYLGDMIQK